MLRDPVSWNMCVPGTLIVKPNVVLKGNPASDVAFKDFEPDIAGNFAVNDFDPINDCPTRFFRARCPGMTGLFSLGPKCDNR